MLWLSLKSLGKPWRSSSPGQTRVPSASGSALRFSTAACGERLTAGPGQGLSLVPSSIPEAWISPTFLESQEKATPTSNFSIPVSKVTPAPLSQGSKLSHTLRLWVLQEQSLSRVDSAPVARNFQPAWTVVSLMNLTHAPRRWGSVPLAVRPKPQKTNSLRRVSTSHASSHSSRKAAQCHCRSGQNLG